MYILLALFVVNFQGRNFGVKVGVPIQQGPEAREEENGERLIRLWSLRERHELS